MTTSTTAARTSRSTTHTLVWVVGLVLLSAAATLISLRIGSRAVSWNDVFQALTGHQETFEQAAVAKRIPRTILGLLAGASLSLAGALMQGVTRNPVADPGILGG